MYEIRKLKVELPNNERVETGPVQFNEDWPGVFIRGDNCFGYRLALAGLRDGEQDPFQMGTLHDLIDLLDSCNLNTKLVEKLKENDERRDIKRD